MPLKPKKQAVAIALDVARKMRADGGAVSGAGNGRDDNVAADVPDGSHVIPADVVSALGVGNTEAGFKALDAMFKAVGREPASKGRLPVAVSDGEYIVPPAAVEAAGGHDVLNKLIMEIRQRHIERLKNLGSPVQGGM